MKIRVYSYGRLKLLLGLLIPSDSPEDFPELVMGHIIIWTESETLTVESDGLLGALDCLSLFKVAKGTIAVLPFLLRPLPSHLELFDLAPLPHDLILLPADQLLLFADQFRLTGRKKNTECSSE